jgi:hypothetical protein
MERQTNELLSALSLVWLIGGQHPDALFTAHEFVNEDGTTPYREALIPAAHLNAYGPPRLFAEAEVDELEAHDPRFQ